METNAIANSPGLARKLLYVLAAFSGLPFLTVMSLLAFINVNKADNLFEVSVLETTLSIVYAIVPALILVTTLIWHWQDLKARKSGSQIPNEQLMYYCLVACRYSLAAIIIFYGLDKLMVNQLHSSYYWYGDELGDLSGFQLTWSFFGYSKLYNSFIAVAQVLGGTLLLFKRTTLIGALLLLPILGNIALIDFNYDIPAKDIISVLLLLDIFLVSISLRPLWEFFVLNKTVDAQRIIAPYSIGKKKYSPKLKSIALSALILFVFMTNFKQMKNDNSSPIEGAWRADSVQNFTDSAPEKNKKLTLKWFVDGKVVTVKKTYQYEDFNLALDEPTMNMLSLQSIRDSLHQHDIRGTYTLVNNRLQFRGREGADSVYWVFSKASR